MAGTNLLVPLYISKYCIRYRGTTTRNVAKEYHEDEITKRTVFKPNNSGRYRETGLQHFTNTTLRTIELWKRGL